MKRKTQHLIFFDDSCSLCWRSVNRILAWDKKGVFRFSPLRDKSAKMILKQRWDELSTANTLILIECYTSSKPKIWIRGRAILRILWLLGGWWKLLGWMALIPIGIDSIYSFIANRRHRL